MPQGLALRPTNTVELIKKDPTISRQELATKLSINPSAVQKHLQRLKAEGLLERIGPDKGGYWDVEG